MESYGISREVRVGVRTGVFGGIAKFEVGEEEV